jgi:hypothetical protein
MFVGMTSTNGTGYDTDLTTSTTGADTVATKYVRLQSR